MKSLVIYDSNFGNTKTIAELIAATLHCEARHVSKASLEAMKNVDLLVVGSPINAWRPTPAIQKFLSSLEALTNVRAAGFDTRMKTFLSGNAAKRINNQLKQKGAKIIAQPKGFYVTGKEGPLEANEKENAANWANELVQLVNNG
ncbi:MAG: flavodoxin domain-containing protein [Bacteroidia bacterium]|nr:flavodoxin domain-containing protein [Bacteroidia bacterium]